MTVTGIGILHTIVTDEQPQQPENPLEAVPNAAIESLLHFVENALPDGSIFAEDALSEDEASLWEDWKRVQSWLSAWSNSPAGQAQLKRQLERA